MAEAVHRMTGFPARKFGIVDRGVVRPGAFADLVVFDPARIADVGTYADPHHPPAGIVGVLVNGRTWCATAAHDGAPGPCAAARGATRRTDRARDADPLTLTPARRESVDIPRATGRRFSFSH